MAVVRRAPDEMQAAMASGVGGLGEGFGGM
jgi:hypothetical protein